MTRSQLSAELFCQEDQKQNLPLKSRLSSTGGSVSNQIARLRRLKLRSFPKKKTQSLNFQSMYFSEETSSFLDWYLSLVDVDNQYCK